MRNITSKLAGRQSGFTLIELVIVIVIIGILAAVAIPQFSNLTDDANKAKTEGIAGAANSAFGTYRALCAGNLASCTTAARGHVAAATCASAILLTEGGATLPTGWTVTGSPPACVATAPA